MFLFRKINYRGGESQEQGRGKGYTLIKQFQKNGVN